MARHDQPNAVESYYFGKCYRDVGNTIKGSFARNLGSIREVWEKRGDVSLTHDSKIAIIFLNILYIIAILSIAVFGTAVTLGLSVLMCAAFVIMMAAVYIGFTVVFIIDRIYLQSHKIFTACNECKERSLIPTYLCPACGAEHTYLVPSRYGILHRTCKCGATLPTTFFNGRRELDAICPHCGTRLADRESVPICIPIVGGRSVGKTAFITAFSKQFFDEVAPDHGWTTEFYNHKKEEIYGQIEDAYASGDTIMTERQMDPTKPSAVSFSFFVEGPEFRPERLVHVYDIAGEVFTQNDENEAQKQYEYCQGIVLMVDPLAIPEYRMEMELALTREDIAGIGDADINDITDSFLNKLRQVTGLSDKKMAEVPLAVVISKADSGDLEDRVGPDVVYDFMNQHPEVFKDYYNTQDYLCRQFLREYGMADFVNSVSLRFKTNRFFACSAIGHSRNDGAYEPQGVLAPMEWLFAQADKKMADSWNEFWFPQHVLTDKELEKLTTTE